MPAHGHTGLLEAADRGTRRHQVARGREKWANCTSYFEAAQISKILLTSRCFFVLVHLSSKLVLGSLSSAGMLATSTQSSGSAGNSIRLQLMRSTSTKRRSSGKTRFF